MIVPFCVATTTDQPLGAAITGGPRVVMLAMSTSPCWRPGGAGSVIEATVPSFAEVDDDLKAMSADGGGGGGGLTEAVWNVHDIGASGLPAASVIPLRSDAV